MSQFVTEFQYVIIIIIIFNRVQPGEHILFELIIKIPLNYNLVILYPSNFKTYIRSPKV